MRRPLRRGRGFGGGIAPAATHEADRQLIREIARNAVSKTVASGFPGG